MREVKEILAQGMAAAGREELARLLAHADMRVRQEAQFELAGRGDAGWQALAAIAGSKARTLPRIHAVWGLGQAARTAFADGNRPSLWPVVGPLLGDADPEVRAQAAKVLGDAHEARGLCGTRPGCSPTRSREFVSSRRSRWASSAGRGGRAAPGMLRDNADKDAYLRHAGGDGPGGLGQDRGVDEGDP